MRKRKWPLRTAQAAAVLGMVGSFLLPLPAREVQAERGVVDLWKSIKPLTTVASLMNTGAHPDDEHSALLAYSSLGLGVATSSVIANRGEGGQNEIGSELGNALGVIRSRELQEASKITNVTLEMLSQDIDDPIFDFGFSKSPEETLQKWNENVAYERLIRNIRKHRPDVLIPAFLNEPSTHGHHRAINILTVKAFEDAAKPDVFPEHLKEGLKPWQVKKLYVPANKDAFTTAVPIGTYDEIYGASYVQLGEESRSMHKSQGMGRDYHEGPQDGFYKLEKAVIPVPAKEGSLFDGISFTFEDLAKEVETKGKDNKVTKDLRQLQKDADEIVNAYPRFRTVAEKVHHMLQDVRAAVKDVEASSLSDQDKADLLFRLNAKLDQLNRASAESNSVVVKVIPDTGELVRGQTAKVTVRVFNGGQVDLKNLSVKLNLPSGWQAAAKGATSFKQLGYNQTGIVEYDVTVPANADGFHPYRAPVVSAAVEYSAFDVPANVTVSPKNTVAVLPEFSVSLSPNATVLNTLKSDEPIPVTVGVRNYTPGAAQTTVSLEVPEGWNVEPKQAAVSFSQKGETKSASFTVKAPAGTSNGKYQVKAKAVRGSVTSNQSVQVIEYPHIGRTYLVSPSVLNIQAFDLGIPSELKVGYVSSGFDNIDQYLRQVGVNVTNLDANEVQFGDLSKYNTIVLGIRAYGFRPDLLASSNRLLEYVKNGGNLVVQYHKPEDKWKPELAPYPIKIGTPLIQWRVTDENSKVTMLAPDHPIFNTPNKITEQDWANWVQDRSAYNPAEWGKEYVALISNGDPGEKEFTGTFLTANYGKGTYTYSSLAWYRQIPSLVPGSFRLFVNMISLHQ
ncbi:NEW3 domain-containing protein [Effusibacillus consociatus]|uniref:NEW3 domain-containing protein n=1 Tax=Effusibacillus consociatus TaxID=1117041 RepID=A0ABV9PVG9_9BACL